MTNLKVMVLLPVGHTDPERSVLSWPAGTTASLLAPSTYTTTRLNLLE